MVLPGAGLKDQVGGDDASSCRMTPDPQDMERNAARPRTTRRQSTGCTWVSPVLGADRDTPDLLGRALALIALLFMAVCVVAPSAGAAREVRVGTWDYPPQVMIGERGDPEGIFIDIVEEVGARNDWHITYVHGTWHDTLRRLESGAIDLGLGIGQIEKRQRQFDLNAEPVISDWGQLYTRRDDAIETVLDLEGKTVTGWRDDRTFEAFRELVDKLGVHVTFEETGSGSKNFDRVAHGEADAVVELHIPGTILQERYGLVAGPLVFNPISFGFGTQKGHDADLLRAIDVYLREQRTDPDSAYNRSLERWLGPGAAATWRVPGYLVAILASVAGIAALLVGMSVLLRRQVRRRTAALSESQERYRTLVENAPVAIFVNRDDRVVLVNDACLRLFGAARPEQLLGKSPYELFHPDHHESIRSRIRELREEGRPVPLVEEKIVRLDGAVVDVEIETAPFRFEGADAIHVVLLDITERKRSAAALEASAEQLRTALHDTVKALGAIVGLRDPYTADHEQRVTRLAEAIAIELGLDEDTREGLMLAGEVHDVGKIAIPAEILSKPGALADTEYLLVKQHVAQGEKILSTIGFARPVAAIVGQHHERLDGSGYPRGLAGDQILLEARVLAVADVVEAMASHRPYRAALGVDAALDEIRQGAGTLYDGEVVSACERVINAGFDLTA